jgi:hypothetical protein
MARLNDFDWLAFALAKSERGSSRDLHDVELLQQNGLTQRDDQEAACPTILPQVGRGRYRTPPEGPRLKAGG